MNSTEENEKQYIETLFPSLQNDDELVKYARDNFIPVLVEDTQRLLAFFIKLKQPKKILEIGTAIGYSSRIMLQNAPSDTTVDTIEIDENSIKTAKQTLKDYLDRVNIIQGDALKVLPTLNSQYDFVFLDGPKAQYVRYLPYIKNLLKTGGILFADDVMMRGMVGGGVTFKHRKKYMVVKMRVFLKQITQDNSFQTVVLQTGDGVSISIKKGE